MRTAQSPKPVLTTLLALGLALALAGCATAMVPGKVIVDHVQGNAESPGEAPRDGWYALYPKFGSNQPKHRVLLRRGDRLGFRTAKTGEIKAVAGDHEWGMTDNNYLWMVEDPAGAKE